MCPAMCAALARPTHGTECLWPKSKNFGPGPAGPGRQTRASAVRARHWLPVRRDAAPVDTSRAPGTIAFGRCVGTGGRGLFHAVRRHTHPALHGLSTGRGQPAPVRVAVLIVRVIVAALRQRGTNARPPPVDPACPRQTCSRALSPVRRLRVRVCVWAQVVSRQARLRAVDRRPRWIR